ncbi:exodeoxyribonuclease V subunit beta [Roseivirga sp. E12]|uniref:UvrD-helicase domain-containing protein n=1 Tax=Roseivirga sp. E12 TaxID=2819237 RepID=UPI001ABCB7DF|nr:UvrD-helicase domain-containing protein [Roseivirga sp. E12]MBO3696958.1 UvrD-helicase domain-containing protein [Roseivirga sp. E12]
MPLTVYKSSAGSGKTFTLVREYLKLVLLNPNDFKHILAITFTNKATEEMKRRILDALLELSEGSEGPMFQSIKSSLSDQLDDKGIQMRASEAYELIIHNYGRFEISTIDSFFSKVLRSFARELDLPLSYELEMNTSLALSESIDQLFRSLDDNKQVRDWLVSFANEQMENDKSWNVDQNMEKLGKSLFSEAFQDGFREIDLDLDRLKELILKMSKTVKGYENELKAFGNEALDLLTKHSLVVEDFKGGSRSVANTFKKLVRGDFSLTASFLKTVNGDDTWYTKTSPKVDEIDALVAGRFGEIGPAVVNYIDSYQVEYNTAKVLLKNIFSYGLLEELNKHLKDYRDEHNVMLISDNNLILKDILAEADAPFIFEKLGSFFKHIMIDEFQDTSNFQWSNLQPLVINALSEDNNVLIVGDVKQSIYRFRGGNMKLLLSELKRGLGAFYTKDSEQNLADNYRSLGQVVNFNNQLFEQLPVAIGQHESITDTDLFEMAYAQHHQEAKGKDGGFVRVRFYEKDESPWKASSLNDLVDVIKTNQSQGFEYSDFLVLVNANGEIPDIANALLAENIPFINGESLRITQSDLVVFILEVFRYLQSDYDEILSLNLIRLYHQLSGRDAQKALLRARDDRMSLEEAAFPKQFLDQKHHLKQQSLFDLVSEVLLIFDFTDHADIYIQQLQDVILEQTQKGINSINTFMEWWDNEGYDTTVSANEKTNAVRIMSIHKSKGLEAPIVCIPFAHWSILPPVRHQFWTRDLPIDYQDLQFVPLDYSKRSLSNSHFAEAFYQESKEFVLDVLNKTYVAFTRAREKLYIGAPNGELKGRNAVPSNIQSLLWQILPNLNGEEAQTEAFTDYSFGNSTAKEGTNDEKDDALGIKVYPSSSYLQKLTIRNDSERFFMLQETEDAQNITIGNQVHVVLSAINTSDDLEPVLKQMQQAGELDDQAVRAVALRIKKLFQDPLISPWFSEGYDVLNEREIWHDNRIHKPDRILTQGNKAIVIDYKKEKEAESHHDQVRRYMKAMQALGFEAVEGHLIYVEPVVVREVAQ